MKEENNYRCILLGFYFSDIELADFKRWLWSSNKIEGEIGADNYFKLIDLDLDTFDEIEKAKDYIKDIYRKLYHVDIRKDYVRLTLERMLSGKITITNGCKILADLAADGYTLVPIVFIGYSSELVNISAEQFYRERIINDVRKLLDNMNTNNNETGSECE
jgi:hypothetical protein